MKIKRSIPARLSVPKVQPRQTETSEGARAHTETYEVSTPLWKRALHALIPSTQPRERQWTILYYGAGNNNLSRSLNMEMGSLRNAGSSEDIKIVAQLAREGQDGQVVRGEMAKVSPKWGAVNPSFEEVESFKADMGQKATYTDFLRWGMKTFPAEHYLVIQAGHGDGHRGSMTDETTGSFLTLPQEREAHEAAPAPIDVLLKESCMGASVEEAYELKDQVGYFVASQDSTQGNVELHGFAQEARDLAHQGDLSPRKLVETMAGNLCDKATTFVAVDTSKLDAVAEAVADFQKALGADDVEAVRVAATQTPSIEADQEDLESDNEIKRVTAHKRQQYRDAIGFAENVADSVPSLEVQAKVVAENIRESILHQYSGPGFEEQQGLSWNISPDPGLTAGASYPALSFAQDTRWTGLVGS